MQKSVTLLLVEDEPVILLAAQDALEDAGFVVLVASDGTEAIALIEAHGDSISGLLTDIRLGSGPSGWEIARHARRMLPDIAILYASGHGAEHWEAEGAPRSALLQKPYSGAQLVAAVSVALARHGAS